MIEEDHGVFTMSCDVCEEYEIFDTDGTWNTMIKEARDLGWRSRKEEDGWKNYCPACAKELR